MEGWAGGEDTLVGSPGTMNFNFPKAILIQENKSFQGTFDFADKCPAPILMSQEHQYENKYCWVFFFFHFL